jgi:soluble lytic murein transglycosylase-like protein
MAARKDPECHDQQGIGTNRRRRAVDLQAPDEQPARTRRQSARALMQRYRQPLIGLGLAGMALPLVRVTNAPQRTSGEDPEASSAPDPAATAMAGEQDTEENLAERIAATTEEREREEQVTEAMERYSIARDLAEDIYDVARETNIEPRLAYGLVKTESTFNERAVSPVGARGLTQVMPRTAAWLVPGTRTQDLYDRQTNLRLGFTYLDQMIDKYKGNVRLALLAYNRGPGTVDKVLKRGGNPDNGYADKVLRG